MDGERAWFVYRDDAHHGPFDQEDMRARIQAGMVGANDLVWSEKMQDWVPLQEVQTFVPFIQLHKQKVRARRLQDEVDVALAADAEQSKPAVVEPKMQFGVGPSLRRRALASAFFLLALAGAGYSYQVGVWDPWLKPGPAQLGLAGVLSSEDQQELWRAVAAPLETLGRSFAVVPFANDKAFPVFYLGTNLPDKTVLTVTLEGIADTLLNRISIEAKREVVVQGGVGKTTSFASPDGLPLPRGEYRVGIQGEKFSKVLFLGGARDNTYLQELQEFHKALQAQAQNELMELKQLAVTLENQLMETNEAFGQIMQRAQEDAVRGERDWASFHGNWALLEKQVSEGIQGTQGDVPSERLFGKFYLALRDINTLVSQVHQKQGRCLGSQTLCTEAETLDIADKTSIAQSTILALKARIQVAERLPPTMNGMPQLEVIDGGPAGL